jgi:hypothetical protein
MHPKAPADPDIERSRRRAIWLRQLAEGAGDSQFANRLEDLTEEYEELASAVGFEANEVDPSVEHSAQCEDAPRMQLQSILTCPHCGHRSPETMPTNACQFFYDCQGCGTRLKPKQGDCCVFCSFGSVRCPPVQENGKGTCCS